VRKEIAKREKLLELEQFRKIDPRVKPEDLRKHTKRMKRLRGL